MTASVTRASIAVQGLTLHRGRRRVLSDVSFEVGTGVTCVLGPNGSGKSTLFSVLATLLPPPRRGQVRIGDADLWAERSVSEARSRVSLLPQRFSLMSWASVRENLDYAAWAKGVPHGDRTDRVEEVADLVGLTSRLGDRAKSLSGGMRQRLGFACSVVHAPPILLLDEPTVGIDPEHRIALRRTIRRYGESTVVLVATHVLEDAQFTADRLLVLLDGRVSFDGSVHELGTAAPDQSPDASALEAGYLQLLDRTTVA